MLLAKHGVVSDYMEGLKLSKARRFALVVIALEHDGGQFNWSTLTWTRNPSRGAFE